MNPKAMTLQILIYQESVLAPSKLIADCKYYRCNKKVGIEILHYCTVVYMATVVVD